MFRFALIIIACSALYYFTKDIKLAAGLFILLILGLIWSIQVSAVRKKESINQAVGNIEDAFQKRHDMLSKIYETTKGLIKFKENEMEAIVIMLNNVKNAGTEFKERLRHQDQVKSILINNLEKLRDDKVSNQFLILTQSINEVEENLSAARRFYNYSVKEYNSEIGTFPASVIAKIKGFQTMSYFEVENENIKENIEIKF